MTEQNQSSQFLAESLSALMDNEAEALELQRLLKASETESAVKSTWARYQMSSAALRGDLPTLAPSDFAARVSAALESEATYSEVNMAAPNVLREAANPGGVLTKPAGWWQQVGRVAIAASVAGALVLGVQQYQTLAPQSNEFAATEAIVAPVNSEVKAADLPSGINAPALSARTVAVQSGYESRPQENRRVLFVPRQDAAAVNNEEISTYVNRLIEAHSDNAALNSGQGMLPYTRVIMTEEGE